MNPLEYDSPSSMSRKARSAVPLSPFNEPCVHIFEGFLRVCSFQDVLSRSVIKPHYLVLKEEAPHRLPAEHRVDVGLLGAEELEPHPELLELPGDVRQHPEDLKV